MQRLCNGWVVKGGWEGCITGMCVICWPKQHSKVSLYVVQVVTKSVECGFCVAHRPGYQTTLSGISIEIHGGLYLHRLQR